MKPILKAILTVVVSCVLSFQLHAQVSFTFSSSPVVGPTPFWVTAADVNGDGWVDLICANENGASLSVLTNDGSGGFVTSGTYAVGGGPVFVTTADVNGNGKVDLICANWASGTLTVLTNDGSGGFVTSGTYAAGSYPTGVTTADVNGDGKVDLIIANGENTFMVYTNNGSGGFVLASTPDLVTTTWSITAADVNGNGKVDLISPNLNTNTLSVYTNNGSSGFVMASTLDVGNNAWAVTAADVNGDGKVDLICANYDDNTLTVLTNNGSGGFTTSGTYAVGSGPGFLTVADVNGDGWVDLICVNYGDNTLSVLTNNGSGGFMLTSTYAEGGSGPGYITAAAADVNGDGKVDLIYANSDTDTLTVLTNATPFSAPSLPPVITGFNPASAVIGTNVTISGTNFSSVASNNIVYFGAVQATVAMATLTNLVVTVPAGATYAPITVTINGLTAYADQPFMPTFLGDGSGITANSFGPQLVLPAGSGPIKVVIADLDGDGKPDLIVANDYGNTISLYRNISTNGLLTTNSFAPPVSLATPPGSYSPFGLAVADVDGDGKLDIIVSDYSESLVSVYRNTCTPGNITSNSFATRVDFATGAQPQGVEVRDLDGDGKPDLVVANNGDGSISILRNTSVMGSLTTNSFAPKIDIVTGSGCQSVAVGDLDGDGKPDVVAINSGNNTVSLLRNTSTPGRITFAANADIPVFLNGPNGVAIGDLDGDGKPDLIVTCYLPQSVSVFRNISTAGSLTTNSFAPEVDYSLGGRGHTPAIADLDGDGKPDLAVVTELNSLLSIFRNLSAPGSFTTDSFAPRVDFATGYNAWGVSIGDLNGDGRPDIVFANSYDNTISIYQNIVALGGQPVITSQPTNQTVDDGGTASFNVMATGATPLNFQWSLNGMNIEGATSSDLTISNVSQSDLGTYTVLVSNLFGSVTSSNAMLSMYPYLAVPFGGAVTDWGQDTILSVQAGGSGPFSYQWYDNGVAILNATNQTLDLSSIQFTNAGLYSVVVSSPFGSVTNTPEQVVVNPAGVSLGLYPGVTVSGTVGYTYIIQSNPDLTNTNGWTTVATLTLFQPVELWVDVNNNASSPTNTHRFYRVLPAQ